MGRATQTASILTRIGIGISLAIVPLFIPLGAQAAPPPPVNTGTNFPPPTTTISAAQFSNLVCPPPNGNIPPGGDFYSAVDNYCTVIAPNGKMMCYYTGVDSLKHCKIEYSTGEVRTLDQQNLLGLPGIETDEITDEIVDAEGETLAAGKIDTSSGDGCSMPIGFNLGNCLSSIAGKVGASIILIFVGVFGMMLGFAGMLLNWVMLITVFQYSTYFGNSEGMLIAWSVLRDLGNIILLFGFIFIGLQTILNLEHFSVGKALPRLIIFAILINFSLFVSEAIVDTANLFGSTFYTQAGQVDCTQGVNTEDCANKGIAAKVMQASGISSVLSWGGNFEGVWGSVNGVDTFFSYFMMLILIIIMLVVFVAAVILFLIRAVVLMFLLVTSPLGFAAMAIPQFEEYSKMWWNSLIKNAFFAPIFLLLLLVGLKIMDGANAIFNSGNASMATAIADSSTGAGGIFILYALITGFMIAALMVAKNMGAMGASFAISSSSKMVGSATFGATGFVTRRTAGRAMQNLADKHRNTDFGRSGLGRMVIGGLDKGGSASYDVRASKTFGNVIKATPGGMDFGEARKGGYAKLVHDEEEKAAKYAAKLGNTREEKNIMSSIDKKIAEKQQNHSVELSELDSKHKLERDPIQTEIAARETDAANARARGDTAALQTAELAINNLRLKYNELTKTQTEARTKVEQEHKTWIAEREKEKKDLKEAPQREFVARMGESPNIPVIKQIHQVGYALTAGPDVRHHTSERVLKELSKSENQKLTDALIAATKAAKPASAPAGGGGGGAHGAAPAGGGGH